MGKYDLLIKENLSHLVRPLAKRIGLDLEGVRIETLKDKLQYTIEREPDYLCKICHRDPLKDFICQFDFQAWNDPTMPIRMLYYWAFLKIIYDLPVRQIVFYISDAPLTMVNHYEEENISYKYELIDIRSFSSASFLESDIPQVVLLAVLGNFEGETPDVMMEKIILRLETLSKQKKDFQKLAFQLHVLCGLRKLHKIFNEKIKKMELVYDLHLEMDPIYQDGIEIGDLKRATFAVEKHLLNGKLAVKVIADWIGISETFVRSVQDRLVKEGRLSLIKRNGKTIRQKL